MNRMILYVAMAALMLTSCENKPETGNKNGDGSLSFANFELKCNDDVEVSRSKSTFAAPGNYIITITNEEGVEAFRNTYSSIKASDKPISLPAGKYTMQVSSSDEPVPAAAFEQPIYGASVQFSITAGKTTEIQPVTCRLLQCKVTVSYDEAFLEDVTGNGVAKVEVTAGKPLNYDLKYENGSAYYDKSAGYFAINNGENTTMAITFTGKIKGEDQTMTTPLFSGIKAAQWRQVTFVKKVDEEGNATFFVKIDGYIEDSEIACDVTVPLEDTIGEDPDAPVGDGGIKLEFAEDCTMFNDLSNIEVPALGTPMDLRLVATIPNGVKKFTVDIASTSTKFINAVNLAGGTTLDLINPTPESGIVFDIVPFPHGQELVGKTSVNFDLGAAQEPILGFQGAHTFTMKILDTKGCRKEISVIMTVK